MKQKFLLCILACLTTLGSWAITQNGNVRTIARKGRAGSPIEGAVIRLQGTHNKVASRANGDFALLLHELHNGDAYSIASIVKSGYEPAEQELIGRKLPCSDKVPVEILLVNRIELMQEKEEIENKARENVEIYYQARLDSLERLVAERRITEEEMRARRQQLESQYENFEPLLQAMSDVLARTDYRRMDSLTALMQQAVENGNPEEAERIVREKGSITQRENILREWGKNIQALRQEVDKNQEEYNRQKKQLEEDCFRMYSAFLTRFRNDSAAYYIQKRAALDTLNIDYQLQAGQFMRDIMADYPEAQRYFERAYRIASSQYTEVSGQMATTANELGLIYKQQGQLETAMVWYQRSMNIREQLRGKNSVEVAEALNNMGELFRTRKDLKRAMECHKRALKIRQKQLGSNSPETAVSMNNIAGVMYQLKQYSQAEKLFTEVRDIYAANPKVTPSRVAANYNNLGGVCYQQGKYEDAALYFDRALTIYRKVLGDRHPMTLNALKNSNICKQKIQTQNQ